jgi:hypothetical protein
LADANAADEPVEIRVAQGTYTPDQGSGVVAGNRDATFRLVSSIVLRGGYAGLGNGDPNERDPARYVSVLSGDLKGDDVPVQTPEQLLGEPTRRDNSRHVVTIALGTCLEGDAAIDAFTIASGLDDVEADSLASEGGAGILILSGSLTLTDCTIRDNAARNIGGGMYATAGCALTLRNCVYTQNLEDQANFHSQQVRRQTVREIPED